MLCRSSASQSRSAKAVAGARDCSLPQHADQGGREAHVRPPRPGGRWASYRNAQLAFDGPAAQVSRGYAEDGSTASLDSVGNSSLSTEQWKVTTGCAEHTCRFLILPIPNFGQRQTKKSLTKHQIETHVWALMSIQYQRNQVEASIARTIDPRSVKPSARVGDDVSAAIRSRAKRLLDADRTLPTHRLHAFYSNIKPGTGNVNTFSFLDAFMLMLGICLNGHFWPQKTVVEVLRLARPKLDRELDIILALDPKWLYDPKAIAKVPESSVERTIAYPKYFIVATDGGQSETDDVMFRILDPNEAFRFQMEKVGRATTGIPITKSAHDLRKHLSEIEPAKRGRS